MAAMALATVVCSRWCEALARAPRSAGRCATGSRSARAAGCLALCAGPQGPVLPLSGPQTAASVPALAHLPCMGSQCLDNYSLGNYLTHQAPRVGDPLQERESGGRLRHSELPASQRGWASVEPCAHGNADGVG